MSLSISTEEGGGPREEGRDFNLIVHGCVTNTWHIVLWLSLGLFVKHFQFLLLWNLVFSLLWPIPWQKQYEGTGLPLMLQGYSPPWRLESRGWNRGYTW